MVFKAVVLCMSALMIQSTFAICARPGPPNCGCISYDECGGPLVATSFGPITPSGLAVASDLALDGNLKVSGALPFLSAVAFEGSYATSGSAAASYGCGDGNVGITQEILNPGGNVVASGVGIGPVGVGGCGCRRS